MIDKAYDAITILGNCQGEQLAGCLRRMLPGTTVEFIRYFDDVDLSSRLAAIPRRLVLVQNPVMSFGPAVEGLRTAHDVLDFPAIVHAGFHPDLIRPKVSGKLIHGPMGSNHSAIVLYGYLRGLDESETQALFCEDVFNILGYFGARAESNLHLRSKFSQFGLLDEDEIAPLLASGCFMHVTIHPKLPVIAALARLLLRKAGIIPTLNYPENLIADDLANNVIWPIYPEIARRLGVIGGEYVFQFKPTRERTFNLPGFIAASFAAYRAAAIDASCHARLGSDEMLALDAWRARPREAAAASHNPYRAFPDHQFWRRAVAAVGHDQLDPVAPASFKLDAKTRIGTAGSCFAQHIARRLAASGHNYLVTEAGEDLDAAERGRRNFGVYSARYGNIYTARQLRQLFERAQGTFSPQETAWRRADGRFIDPLRPEIEPDGFASPEAVAAAREQHFSAVRTLFRNVDVLVFTLGLTEAWQSIADGLVFPLCPMVVSPEAPPEHYAPINFSHAEIVEDLTRFIALLREINPAVRVLLTVSPVPLIATFEDRHIMVSTSASKAILRSVADAACRADAGVSYFPSYEIVANPYFAASYFDPADCRSVLPEGVDHVMRVFLKHYSQLAPGAGASLRAAELDDEQKVVCEEERLEF
jgi:hypothetical protein